MKKLANNHIFSFDGPLLDKAYFKFENSKINEYPFCLKIIKNLKEIIFPTNVTFFVGENGSGKSTLLEAIACKAGFGLEGGSKNINFKTSLEKNYEGPRALAKNVTLSWRFNPINGYFFRAESFFNVANFIDSMAQECGPIALNPYGGKSLHEQSHGESFLSFFKSRLDRQGFFIFDEPEAALSPQRQLCLLNIMHNMCENYNSQFIIATHSPILLAYPNSTIYSLDGEILKEIKYKDTEHYKITKQFLDNPDAYLRHLLNN